MSGIDEVARAIVENYVEPEPLPSLGDGKIRKIFEFIDDFVGGNYRDLAGWLLDKGEAPEWGKNLEEKGINVKAQCKNLLVWSAFADGSFSNRTGLDYNDLERKFEKLLDVVGYVEAYDLVTAAYHWVRKREKGKNVKFRKFAIYEIGGKLHIIYCERGELKIADLGEDVIRDLWGTEDDRNCELFPNGAYQNGKSLYETYGAWLLLGTLYKEKSYVFEYLSSDYIYTSESFTDINSAIAEFFERVEKERQGGEFA